MKKREREVQALVTRAGLTTVRSAVNGSGHFTVYVRAPDGRERPFTITATPSDSRGDRNKLADMRRFAKGIWR